LRPYGVLGNVPIVVRGHGGTTSYHSLQTQVVSHFGRGSQFQASYTFSKSLGTVPSGGGDGGNNSPGARGQRPLRNPNLSKGPRTNNRRHIFNASLVLVLPTFDDKDGFTKHVLGGWEFSTIAQVSSGLPLTVYTGAIPGLPNRVSGTGYNGNQRPNVVPGQDCHAHGGLQEQILNQAAWTLKD